ncbi:MAG: DUF4321 domain-containing protein [Gemmatimonadales bacterium]|nr:DUF4321 domain-containing protein [Gemmatimonadota bacterium]MCC7132896.1 DUF4321 domain-containing protein [Gemmatimonadales bacterium]MDX2056534.1 DUF4321 domain-containing protein [Gemmatimonadales bacterium]
MRAGPRRPRFYLAVLATGFLLGGFLQEFLSRVLPESPARSFFTTAARGEFGPAKLDLMVVDLTVGPVGVEISLLSVLGVLIAYLVARSLF